MKSFTGTIYSKQPLGPGDINDVYLIKSGKGDFVLKTKHNAPMDFYNKEAAALELLKEYGLNVPEVIHSEASYLLLEYLEPGKKDEANAGRQLAALHSIKQIYFGLEYDNYIGSLVQKNGIFESWADFYITHRIDVQLNLFFKNKPNPDQTHWKKLRKWIENNLVTDFPSLLHGDIWHGNLYYSSRGPYFLDPSVYRGDRMVDLAFSELFGGFSREFYSAYEEIFPVGKNYPELKSLYQIYPLLVHANLFGSGYYSSALALAKKYL